MVVSRTFALALRTLARAATQPCKPCLALDFLAIHPFCQQAILTPLVLKRAEPFVLKDTADDSPERRGEATLLLDTNIPRMLGVDVDELQLGSRRKPVEWVIVAPPQSNGKNQQGER